jgi:hypothetical protein
MRVSIFIGLFTLAIGIVLSYMAKSLIAVQTVGTLQTTASIIATVLFILLSASMLGMGAGLVLHWLIGFASYGKAFVAELVISFAVFFMGIGATIMSRNWYTAVQVFFAFFTASVTIFSLSFINLFGSIAAGITHMTKRLKKRFRKKR